MIEYTGTLSLILPGGLCADNTLTPRKLKDLTERIKDLDRARAVSYRD